MRWTCYLTKNREKPYRWLQAPYQKCTAKFLWTSLPSFSKSTQREHSIITVQKRDIRRSTQNNIALVKPLLFSNLRVGQKKMHSFGGRPRERIQILLWFIQSSLLSKLWVRCFWLGDLDIQIFSSYGDRSQISQMKVTDGWGTVCCHHSAKKKMSTWLQIILPSYGLFPTESEGFLASIQWKARLASVFSTLQIFSSKGVMGEGLFVTIIQW